MVRSASSMNPDPLARPAEAYRAAAARDPRTFPFGYLAGDPSTGSYGDFLWFASPDDLLAFLCTGEIALLQFDEQDATRIVASLRRAIGTTRDLAHLDLHALSGAFEGWCEVLWLGTFAQLCAHGGAFEKQQRADFRVALALGGHAGPITDEELPEFVSFIAAPGDTPRPAEPETAAVGAASASRVRSG